MGRATARVAPTDGYKKCLQDGAAGHMGPALQGIFVGQGPRALPGVRGKTGRRGEGTPPYGGVARSACVDRGRTEASAPTDGLQEVCGAGDREGRPY